MTFLTWILRAKLTLLVVNRLLVHTNHGRQAVFVTAPIVGLATTPEFGDKLGTITPHPHALLKKVEGSIQSNKKIYFTPSNHTDSSVSTAVSFTLVVLYYTIKLSANLIKNIFKIRLKGDKPIALCLLLNYSPLPSQCLQSKQVYLRQSLCLRSLW